MTITIDLTSLSYHITGIERYALCISEELLKQDKKNKYVLVFRNEIYPVFNKYIDNDRVNAKVLRGKNKLIFNQVILPFFLYSIKSDIYLFMAFTSPVLFINKKIITTIHDMGAWDYPKALGFFQKMYFKIGYRISSMMAKRIITVSNFSKKRISDILNVDPNKISVIYSAVTDHFKKNRMVDFNIIKDTYNIPEKYIMTLSTIEPRKNMELLLKAFSNVQNQVHYDLILVGRNGWKTDEMIKKYNENNRIHITGFVEDNHVSSIYKNAICFVFPTIYEGFGLPPIEALSMGTPVISSDAASMKEVLRNQAIFFESNNLEELQNLLLSLEDKVKKMPSELDDFQRENYRFDVSAKKMLSILEGEKK